MNWINETLFLSYLSLNQSSGEISEKNCEKYFTVIIKARARVRACVSPYFIKFITLKAGTNERQSVLDTDFVYTSDGWFTGNARSCVLVVSRRRGSTFTPRKDVAAAIGGDIGGDTRKEVRTWKHWYFLSERASLMSGLTRGKMIRPSPWQLALKTPISARRRRRFPVSTRS